MRCRVRCLEAHIHSIPEGKSTSISQNGGTALLNATVRDSVSGASPRNSAVVLGNWFACPEATTRGGLRGKPSATDRGVSLGRFAQFSHERQRSRNRVAVCYDHEGKRLGLQHGERVKRFSERQSGFGSLTDISSVSWRARVRFFA